MSEEYLINVDAIFSDLGHRYNSLFDLLKWYI